MISTIQRQFYRVVMNDDGCYSIWPIEVPLPSGWAQTGFFSDADAALNQVAELWRAAVARQIQTSADGAEDTGDH